MISGPREWPGSPARSTCRSPRPPPTPLAMEFLNFCYAHGQLSADTGLGLVSRISQFRAYENKPGFDAYKPMLETLNAPQTKTRPTSPQWQQIVNEVLVPMLQKSIGSNVNYAAVLAAGKANLEKILNQI